MHNIAFFSEFDSLLPDQKTKLNDLFKYIASKACIDYKNTEMLDIEAAVCAILSRISMRINERGIFNISGLKLCGSQAEKSAVWKVATDTGQTYTEYDFLAILEDSVQSKTDQPCAGCLHVERAPAKLVNLKRYHSRPTAFAKMTETSLESPSIMNNLFWQELTWCLTSSCLCLQVEYYDMEGQNHKNDVFGGIYTKVQFENSNKEISYAGCRHCVVKMKTGTLSVNTSIAVDHTSNTPAKCSLIFLWTSNMCHISAPDRLLTRQQQICYLPIYVDFLPALRVKDVNQISYENLCKRLVVPKRCSVCTRSNWLISGCISEINCIAHELSDKHRQCFKVIKYILPILGRAHIDNSFSKINTYHMKNIVLKHSRTCTDTSDDVAACVLEMFSELQIAYTTKLLNSAFIDVNLLDNSKERYLTESKAQTYREYMDKLSSVSETDSWRTYIKRLASIEGRLYS